MSSNKRFRTRTVVPNAGGITDLIAGSSIQTRIVPAAAIDASFASKTGLNAVVLLDKKVKSISQTLLSNKLLDQTTAKPDHFLMYELPFSQTLFLFFIISLIGFALLGWILPFSRTTGTRVLEKWRMKYIAERHVIKVNTLLEINPVESP